MKAPFRNHAFITITAISVTGPAIGVIASQIATGRLNDLKIRVFGERGGLEWCQETPGSLRVDALEGPTRIFHRGDAGLCAQALAASRLPPGHPEGLYEAFANIYAGVRAAILGEGSAIDFPPIADGVQGVRFIKHAIASAEADGSWIRLD